MTRHLPAQWSRACLGEVVPITYGRALPAKTRNGGGEVAVLGSSGVIGRHDVALTAGATLVIGRKGNVGKPFLSEGPCWPIDTVYFAEEVEGLSIAYMYYLVLNLDLARLDRSTAIPGLSRDDFNAVEAPIAPIREQRRIVSAIESYFTRLDDAVASLDRVQRNLKRYRAAVLKAAVEGRLVPTEAERARAEGRSYEPASVLLERILAERRRRWEEAELAKMKAKRKVPKDDRWKAKYVEPVAPDTSELPELPEGWCWSSIDAVCQSVTDGDHVPPPQTKEGVPFLVIGNVAGGHIEFENTRFVPQVYYNGLDQIRRPAYGDILYTVTGSLGIPVSVETDRRFCVQRHIAILRPAGSMNRRYLVHALASQGVFQQAVKGATGTAQKTVALKVLRGIAVPVPPSAEQCLIADEVDWLLSMESSADAAVAINESRCFRLRQSILKRAFEGRLVDQDPTDEPASRLLDRIRAERGSATEKQPRRLRRPRARGKDRK